MAGQPKHYPWATLLKRMNFSTMVLVFLLCVSCYFIGVWQTKGLTISTIVSTTSALANRIATPCIAARKEPVIQNVVPFPPPPPPPPPPPLTKKKKLDFSSHHVDEEDDDKAEVKRKEFPSCDFSFYEYTPCEDTDRSLRFDRTNLIYRERHCPSKKELLKCLVPAPFGYKTPFSWPTSRDFAWYDNVPHRHLTVEKANQNWIQFKGNRFKFPGGGTMFPNGAEAYIDSIGELIDLKDGSIRTAIDTGCGVASWGAYLMSRDILTVSFAPRDTHEAQVQFALERGVPALIGVMASVKLPYPSRAFDMAHCSRCLIPWSKLGGMYLMEVDRVLRPGGYWILSGPPIRWKKYWKGWERSEEDLNAEQTAIEETAKSLCWKKYAEKGDIAIWQKPINHANCTTSVSFCDDNSDAVWNKKMQVCLTRLPEVNSEDEVAGGTIKNWPARVNGSPPRISSGTIKGITSTSFREDRQMWIKRIEYYKTVNTQLGIPGRYRNLLDMNAYLGGFAASLKKDPVWVMNAVPSHAPVNTLGAIFERGLIGTYMNWCEAMSTYPRTYDLIHANGLFTLYANRCNEEDILLEMDRILRPEGSVIIRDDVDVLLGLKKITDAMRWESQIVDNEEGPMERVKLLFAVKSYWTSPKQEDEDS